MSYSHYGKQAEVWKHLPLCDIIAGEQPTMYVETNAAYAVYALQRTPEQQYGIYHFLERAASYPVKDSLYFQWEEKAMASDRYLGSPGLALSILGAKSRYLFFDLDKEALRNIQVFAKERHLDGRVEVHNRDSVSGMMELLPHLPQETLIHVDPYAIHEPNAEGYTYLDVFERATSLGLKCFLWYGYQTLQEKEKLETLIKARCRSEKKAVFSGCSLTLKIIERERMPCAPGVLGSGLLTSHLSPASRAKIEAYADFLTDLYQGVSYRGFSGELYKEAIL